jgi:hypothetical protein
VCSVNSFSGLYTSSQADVHKNQLSAPAVVRNCPEYCEIVFKVRHELQLEREDKVDLVTEKVRAEEALATTQALFTKVRHAVSCPPPPWSHDKVDLITEKVRAEEALATTQALFTKVRLAVSCPPSPLVT